MRQRELLGVACLVIGLCGCATFHHGKKPPGASVPLDTARACADWRWIGVTSKPGVRCPEAPGWSVTPLFSQVAPPPDACQEEYPQNGKRPILDVVRDLNRFCVYEIKDPKKKFKGLSLPPAARADLVQLDKDCAALSLAGDEKKKKKSKPDWKTLSAQFFERTGRTELPGINGRPGVRLAFLDTHPTDERVPRQWWNSGHGYTLAQIARNLVCAPGESGRCAAQITTQLALPILRFDPKNPKGYKTDTARGGYLGLQSHLADAIRREVDDWQEDLQRDGFPRHLVLNLSLAWDGTHFGGLSEQQISDLKAGNQAVYLALEYAASFDALVLAAAGNRKREPCLNRGPLLPAAWENAVLKEESCARRKAPLVYAVGGVGANGDPLETTRSGGMPRRAACGENAVVPTSNPEFPSPIYTGSSVSTAVVSSIAAVVWHFHPELSPRELMDLLDRSGRDLPHTADFSFCKSEPRPVSALSLCATLKHICDDPGFASLPPCPWRATCPEPAKLSASRDDEPPALSSCQPWLFPQPEDIPRPRCTDGCPPAG